MNYPIKLSFKLLAIASQIYVRDANGQLIGYVKQKLLKLKEDINVFADEQQTASLIFRPSTTLPTHRAVGSVLSAVKACVRYSKPII